MAVLFGVAFLLVLLSFLIQIRDSRETISDLNQSNASALQNALKLQEDNQTLAAANDDLTAQLQEAQDERDTVQEELTETQEGLAHYRDWAQEENNLRQNYEFLFQAAQAYGDGDYETCYGLLTEEMDPTVREKFHDAAKAFYDSLLVQCEAQMEAAESAAAE